MSRFQQSSSNSVTTDSIITIIEEKISNIVNNHQINATYDPNNPKIKQGFTRLSTYCNKSGHTVISLGHSREKKRNEEKATPQPNETYSQNCPNRSNLPNTHKPNSNDRSNVKKGRSDSPYAPHRNRSRSNNYSGTVRFEARPDKVNSL